MATAGWLKGGTYDLEDRRNTQACEHQVHVGQALKATHAEFGHSLYFDD